MYHTVVDSKTGIMYSFIRSSGNSIPALDGLYVLKTINRQVGIGRYTEESLLAPGDIAAAVVGKDGRVWVVGRASSTNSIFTRICNFFYASFITPECVEFSSDIGYPYF